MVNVNSEIGNLEKVLVHRPDNGIARISPKRAEELLFDDIVHLPKMQEEHDLFTQVLIAFLGEENVIEVSNLLQESLGTDQEMRSELIKRVVNYEELPSSIIADLERLSDIELSEVLISGYLKQEDRIIFDPIPNFIFTRDIAVTIKDHILITKAAKEARYRENLLTRYIIYTHPLFKSVQNDKIINLNDLEKFPPGKYGEKVSVEGGDIMMFDDDYLLIGISERTTEHAFNSIRDVIFEKKILNNVVQVNIPNERSFMHIDTLFTRISEDDIVAYKPTIFDGKSSNVIVHRSSGDKEIYSSVREFLWGEINRDMRFIFGGNGLSPFQEREQWTDGCNLVALKPSVAIGYDRNTMTDQAFIDAGYQIIPARTFLAGVQSGEIDVAKVENTLITIDSNELSRARGGSHCMTCPILRNPM